MLYPEHDSVIGRSLDLYGEWAEHEIDIVASLLNNEDTIVDVGANVGTHALAFSSRFPESLVYAFEPQPLAFKFLAANVLMNDRKNIHIFNVGCAEQTKIISVDIAYEKIGFNSGAVSLQDSTCDSAEGNVPFLMTNLDRLRFPRRIQFIKIDVEGMEPAVLAGATKQIRESRPIIFFETLGIAALKESRDILAALGYVLYWLETWPYNANNYKGNPENVWARCEMGILAFPREAEAAPPGCQIVTGNEEHLPYRLDFTGGFNAPSAANLPDDATA